MFLLESDLLFILVFLYVLLVFFHYLVMLIDEEPGWLYRLLTRGSCFSNSPLGLIGVGWFSDQGWEVWRRSGRWTYFPLLTVPADSKLGIYPAPPGKGLCFSARLWLYMFWEVSSSALVYLVIQFPPLPFCLLESGQHSNRLYLSAILITVMLWFPCEYLFVVFGIWGRWGGKYMCLFI